MKTIYAIAVCLLLTACEMPPPDSNQIQAQQQERILQEGTSQTGMPAIKNFRERRTLKMIYELRDQEGLSTYTYVVPEQTGKPVFLCDSVGYAISDATGYTNPDKVMHPYENQYFTMTQAEPNGLFTPDVSDANWVLCLDPKTSKPLPVFISSRIVVSAFRLAE
jgi:starvation-inducible outer membrane lipoprotein